MCLQVQVESVPANEARLTNFEDDEAERMVKGRDAESFCRVALLANSNFSLVLRRRSEQSIADCAHPLNGVDIESRTDISPLGLRLIGVG